MSAHRHRVPAFAVGLTAIVCLAALSGCGSGPPGSSPGSTVASTSGSSASGINRATVSSAARAGHFSDPYPISSQTSSSYSSSAPMTFSGTFDEIISCQGPIRPGCFTPSDISVGFDPALQADINSHGLQVRATKAHHIGRAADGTWQMVLSAVVAPLGNNGTGSKGGWNLILHAHPAARADSGPNVASIPAKWTADTLLVGSLDHSTPADYDGKYFSDGGQLYLIYEKDLSENPQVFGLVAQRLDSPSQPAATPPVTLLAPATANGGLKSENYFDLQQQGGFRLDEVGNILKVNGKYLLVYSTGSYERSTYKIGLAWSDTFLPSHGTTYRKVMTTDTKGVWGTKDAQEVDYLLQSQLPNWPHYAGSTVSAPGVGSIVQRDGTWYLFFAGYDPKEKPTGPNQTFNAADRQPYYVPLTMSVPADTTVAQATDRQLQGWVTPQFTSG